MGEWIYIMLGLMWQRVSCSAVAASCSGISWISVSLCSTPFFSALGWAKEFTVQLLPMVPIVVARVCFQTQLGVCSNTALRHRLPPSRTAGALPFKMTLL